MSRITPRIVLLSILILGSVPLGNLPTAKGAGETFTLTPVPGRTQEGNPTGISLILSVSNAMFPQAYTFLWTVTDPAGSSRTISQNALSTQFSWSLTVRYPQNFSGASINLVGFYNVNVTETSPAIKPGAALSKFQIGLTDSLSYQRTVPVLIKASGFIPTNNVTINIAQGSNSASGFPTWKLANATGGFSFSWPTYPATSLGNYSVTLSGTPAKNPPDFQQFTIYPTNVTISRLWASRSSVQRSQMMEFRFNATYLNGVLVSSGAALVRITEPDGVTSHLATASYDSTMQTFRAFYAIPLTSQAGIWTAIVDVKSFSDGLGNGGPLGAAVAGFAVQPASLAVSVVASSTTYSSGNIIPIYAVVVTPGGANYTQGTVTATITIAGRRLAGPISLVYDPSRGEWSGSYNINSTDPAGTWLITVNAYDAYGNAGLTAASYTVNTANSQQSTYPTWLLWLLVLVLVGLGCGILILARRGVTHREVRLDVQAIKHQADQVKSDDFLQSIQAQLKKRSEKMAEEKPKND